MWQTRRISRAAHCWLPACRRSSDSTWLQNSVRIAGIDSGERWGQSSQATPRRDMRIRAWPFIWRIRKDEERTIMPASGGFIEP